MRRADFYLLIVAVVLYPFGPAGAGNPEEGRKLFLTFCSACHGPTGKGDGEASKYLELKPQDFTDQSIMVEISDQGLFNFIRGPNNRFHGARFLPGFQLKLTEVQIWDLVSFIRTLHTKPKGDPINGRKLYLTYCSTCHGREGDGKGEAAEFLERKPTSHTDSQRMSKKTDEELYNIISRGGEAAHKSKTMPPWTTTLSTQQIWDLVAFIRTLHRQSDFVGVAFNAAKNFARYCSVCHGQNGKGNGTIAAALNPRPRDLSDPKYAASHSRLDIYFATMGGGKAVGRSQYMPPWGEVLSEQEIWDLVSYVISLSKK
ncbi:MAG: c-type cytochrome [Candidatus Zixiibacteriota bacterium]